MTSGREFQIARLALSTPFHTPKGKKRTRDCGGFEGAETNASRSLFPMAGHVLAAQGPPVACVSEATSAGGGASW